MGQLCFVPVENPARVNNLYSKHEFKCKNLEKAGMVQCVVCGFYRTSKYTIDCNCDIKSNTSIICGVYF